MEGSSSLFDEIPPHLVGIYPHLVEMTDEQAGDSMDWVLAEYRRQFPSKYVAFINSMHELRSQHKKSTFTGSCMKEGNGGEALQHYVCEIPMPIANFLRRVLGINWIREPRYLNLFKKRFREGLLDHVRK